MSKFMLLYVGPATPPDQMDPERAKELMGYWNRWMDSLGPALIDIGSPTGVGRAVVDDGTKMPASLVNGYSFIDADDYDEAIKLLEGHPFLTDNDGKFRVEVFEVLPTPGM